MFDSVVVMIFVLLGIRTYQRIREKDQPKAYRIVAVDMVSDEKKVYLDRIS